MVVMLIITVVIKPENLNRVRNPLNNFDRNLQFTLVTYNDVAPHFLDFEVHPDSQIHTNTELFSPTGNSLYMR